MMTTSATTDYFLEPFYLNEKMVLNCAAYLFKGYSLENDERIQTNNEGTKSIKAGITFLNALISAGGEAHTKNINSVENRSARRYTVGGLHMSLIDELHNRQMLQAIDPDDLEAHLEQAPNYVEMPAILRPIDFYSLLDTLRASSPIIGEILKSFVRPLYEDSRRKQNPPTGSGSVPKNQQGGKGRRLATFSEPSEQDRIQVLLNGLDGYVNAVDSVLKQLEQDYQRSKQLEMVMWSTGNNPQPYGVVDIDLGDYDPVELRAKLSEANVRVVGKVMRVVRNGQSINLLQKSVVFSALALINRMMEIQGQTNALIQYHQGLAIAKLQAEQIGLLEVHGPAVRVAAMSVCI